MVVDSSSSNYSTNLSLFTRIQRLIIQIKLAGKCCVSFQPFENESNNIVLVVQQEEEETQSQTDQLEETEIIVMERQIQEGSFVLQRSVKLLHFGSWEEKQTAVKEIIQLAKEDMKTRKSLAALGVIPSLVSMLDSEVSDRRRLAVQALIQLADGTYTNKALMVEAGILAKMPGNVDTIDMSTRHEFALLVFSISSLANSQFPIPCMSDVLPFLMGVLESDANIEAKKACLGAIHNLSSMLENVSPLVSNGLVHTLLKLTSEKEASDKALAILGNLVVTVMGKKAIENDSMVPENLIEVMTWEEKPKCQELAAYILMIRAHQSSAQRAKMVQLKIVYVLLEVAIIHHLE